MHWTPYAALLCSCSARVAEKHTVPWPCPAQHARARSDRPPCRPLRRDNNHFVIFDLKKLVACHDFEYIDLFPDQDKKSCYSAFNGSSNPALPSYVERDGRWHHLAVSWTRAGNGLTKIYWDGLLKVQVRPARLGRQLQGWAGGRRSGCWAAAVLLRLRVCSASWLLSPGSGRGAGLDLARRLLPRRLRPARRDRCAREAR